MSLEQIRKSIKKRPDKLEYLQGILKKEKLLNPKTRSAIYELQGENYEKLAKSKNWVGHLIKAAESFDSAGLYDKAINEWRDIVQEYMKVSLPNFDVVLQATDYLRKMDKTKEAQAIEKKLGEKLEIYGVSEKSPYALKDAYKVYELTGQLEEAKRVKRELSTLPKKIANKSLESVVTSILAFGGIGLLFSSLSKPQVISTMPLNAQLAPPFPNYAIYVFLAMFIGGIGYFLFKKLKK